MSIFKRSYRRRFSIFENEEVKLAVDETPKSAYKVWLAKVRSTPRWCRTHNNTALIFNCKESGFRQLYTRDEGVFEAFRDRVPIPGAFDFRAVFDCPACRMAYALCPPKFHETSFETFNATTPERLRVLAKAREFVSQVNKRDCGFKLAVGRPGLGKTRLACNVIGELDVRDTLYVRQAEVTGALRQTYGRKEIILARTKPVRYEIEEDDDDEPETPLHILQNIGFLVLDEIGCTALANDERILFDELIKYRYEHHMPMILISNLPLAGIKEYFGDAVFNRIKHATGNGKFIIQYTGESYRDTTGESYLDGLD